MHERKEVSTIEGTMRRMTNDEARMTKETQNPNPEQVKHSLADAFSFRHSSFPRFSVVPIDLTRT